MVETWNNARTKVTVRKALPGIALGTGVSASIVLILGVVLVLLQVSNGVFTSPLERSFQRATRLSTTILTVAHVLVSK